MAASASGEQEVERHGDIPTPRKRATSVDIVGEREAKRTQSPCPSEALLTLSPPILGVVEQARQSEEQVRTHVSVFWTEGSSTN